VTPDARPEAPAASRAKATTLVMVVLVPAELTCSVESNMIYTAMATLFKLYRDPVRLGWLVTAFLLTSAGAAAVCARVGDLYGRRQVLIVMLAIAGSARCSAGWRTI
jgi:MFS family permease